MASTTKTSSIAKQAFNLVMRHGQRIWNNLTPQERDEIVGLLTPTDGKPFETKSIRLRKTRLKIAREDGRRLPRASLKKVEGQQVEIKVPIPQASHLKNLTEDQRGRLLQLLKKANTGVG